MTLSIWQKFITDNAGNVMGGAEVEVRRVTNGALAVIYEDESGSTQKSNPFTVPSSGLARFYVGPGLYDITASYAGDIVEFTRVALGTAQAHDVDPGVPSGLLTREQLDVRFQPVRLDNLNASAAPTANDDETDGYTQGSLWYDTTSDEVYRAIDVTEGVAVWVQTTLTIDELGSAATQDAGAANGVATLDGNTQHPLAEVRPETVRYLGEYDIVNDVPAAGTKRDVYLLTGAGELVLTGDNASEGDMILWDGTEWVLWIPKSASNNWLHANNGDDFATAPLAGTNAVAAGGGSSAGGHNALALGANAKADSSWGLAIGSLAESVTASVTLGLRAKGTGNYAVCAGMDAQGLQDNSIAVGRLSKSNGTSGIAIGYGAEITGTSHGIAMSTDATCARNGIALGQFAEASAGSTITGGIAIGRISLAAGSTSIAIGKDSVSLGAGIALGTGAEITSTGVAIGAAAESTDFGCNSVGNLTVSDRRNATVLGNNCAAALPHAITMSGQGSTSTTFIYTGSHCTFTLTDATPTEVVLTANARIIPRPSTYNFMKFTIFAEETVSGDPIVLEVSGLIKTDASAVSSLVGSHLQVDTLLNPGSHTLTPTLDLTNDRVGLTLAGEVDKTFVGSFSLDGTTRGV